MDTYYGMPLPLGARGSLPLGGQDYMNAAQYGGPTPEAQAAYQDRVQAEQAAQAQAAAQQQAATQASTQVATQQAGASAQLVDWPTYLKTHTADDPATIYNDYVNTAAPTMLAAMGRTPDQVKAAIDLFTQQTPRPASVPQPVDSGVVGNAWNSLTQAARQTGREVMAGKAVATNNADQLAQYAKEQAGEEALTPAALARWQKTGGLMWNDLPKTAQNILKEPQGAVDAALQAVASFVPFIASGAVGGAAGSIVPGVGNIAGGAVAMGLTAADLAAGGTALSHIRQGVIDAGININDTPAVRQWIADNGSKVFGDSWKAAATEGAITTLTMGVAGKMGAAVTRGLTDAAQVGVAEATAKAAGTEATRAGTKTAAQLASDLKPLAVGKVATEVGGLGASGVAGAVAAGDTPNTNDVVTQSLAMLLPSFFHMRGEFKATRDVGALKPVVPETPPSTKETLGDEAAFPPGEPPAEPPAAAAAAASGSEPPSRTEAPTATAAAPDVSEAPDLAEQADAYRRMADEKLDNEASVRDALGLPAKTKAGDRLKQTPLADEVRAVAEAQTPGDKVKALEALAEAADKRGKGDVVDRAQAQADKLRDLEPPTEDELVDNATAIHIARDIVQEAVNDHIKETTAAVQAEVKGRQDARAAASEPPAEEGAAAAAEPPVPAAAGVPPAGRSATTRKRKAGLKQNPPVLEGAGGADTVRPADIAGPRVDQESPVQAVAPVPERGGPAGTAGVGGEAATGGPKRKVSPLERKGPDVANDVTIAVKDRTLLEQKALIKELAGQGIEAKQAFGRSGRLEFKSPEDKAKAAAYLAEKQAVIDKVGAALTSRAGDVEPPKPASPLTKEAIKQKSDAYYVRKMIDDMGFDRDTAKEMYNEDPAHWREQVDHETAESQKGRTKVPLDPKEIEDAVRKADQDRVDSNKLEDRVLSRPGVPLSPAFEAGLRTGKITATQALHYLSARSDSALTRVLSRQLLKIIGDAGIPIRVADSLDAHGVYLSTRPTESKPLSHVGILLAGRGKVGLTEHTLLHELVHAATKRVLAFPRNPLERAYAQRMQDIYEQALRQARIGDSSEYGFKNVLEFVSEAWSNPQFQKMLDEFTYRGKLSGDIKEPPSIWQEFKNAVASLLTGGTRTRPMTLLEAAISHSAELFDPDIKTTENPHTQAAFESVGKKADLAERVDRSEHADRPPREEYPDKEKFPYGEPMSKERRVFLREENRLYVQNLEQRLERIKQMIAEGKEVNWNYDWMGDTRIRSVKEAEQEIAQQKARYAEPDKEAIDVSEHKDDERVAAFVATPHDALLGIHPDTGERTHIAYRNDDGTYNLYEASTENPKGDADTKRVNLPADEVRRIMQENGSTPLERAGSDFKGEPKNTRTEVNGWQDGTRQFAAFKQADGTWNLYTGDDLSEKKPLPTNVKDYDAVMAEYRKGNYLKTEAQDAARQRDLTPRDMGTYEGPNKHVLRWWDWTAPVKYLAAQMEHQFGKLPEYMRPDVAALLKNSWINGDIRRMMRDEWNPLRDKGMAMLKKYGIKADKFDDDITALVSEERSRAKLATEGYDDLPDLKAKITRNLDEARAHLRGLDPDYLRELKDFARDTKKFADATIDKQVDMGLIPADRATAIKTAYEFYVPIQSGKNTSVGKRATGQSSLADHPMQRLIEQRRSTIMRGYDNMEKRALYELASQYNIVTKDGTKMFDIGPVLKYGFDKDGNITTVLDPLVNANNAIVAMIDGKPYRIAINDPDFLNAVKDSNTPKHAAMMTGMRAAAVFNAVYGGLKTAASPVFAVKNVIRDAATALAQNDPRISTGRLALSFVEPKVWLAALHDAFEIGRDKVGGAHGPIADFAAKVRDAGGLIDRRAAYGLDAVADDVNASIDPAWQARLPAAVKKQFSIEHGLFTKPITVWTKTLENATRMAVFDAANKSGLSDADAAIAAKTTTVNFEPKGAYAGLINPMYVFANAKLQGTRTYADKLGLTGVRGGNMLERLQRGNRRTQVVTGLGLFMGMLAAKYGYDTSEKDKDGRSTYGKLSDYAKDDYFTVKSGGVSIPLPPELTASYIMGQALVDAQINDRWADPHVRHVKAATRFGTAMIQTFAPLGTSMSDPVSDQPGVTADYWKRLILPTPLTTATDIAANTTTFGSPILTGRSPNTPLYDTNAKNYPHAAAVTNALHNNVGMNVAPQTMKYITDQFIKPQVDVFNSIFGGDATTALGQPKPTVWERTFNQTASPFVDKADLQELRDRTLADSYDPLKKGKLPELKMFDDADKQVKSALKGWDNMTPEQRQRVDERITTIRANTLKQYQRAIQQAEGQ